MSIEEFIKKWSGKICDFDNFYGGQCTDVYRMYCQEVLEFPQSPLVKGASEIWNTFLTDYFSRVENTPEGLPNKGDIVIWNKNTGGGYGHIAIFTEGDVNSFKSFDQNWPIGSKCHIQGHYYKNVLGWLKPKNGNKKYTEEEMTAMRSERDANWDKYTEMKEISEEWRRQYEKEKAERESYDNFIKRLAVRLNCTGKMQDIEGVVQELIEKEDAEMYLKKEIKISNGQINQELIEKDDLTKRVGILLDKIKGQEQALQRLTATKIKDLTVKELFVLWFNKLIGRG